MNRNRTKYIVAAVLAFAVCNVVGATVELQVPGQLDFSRVNPALQIESNGPAHTRISLQQPLIAIQDSFVNFDLYKAFAIPGEPYLYEDGAPTIPQVTRFYAIPNTGGVDIDVLNLAFEEVENIDPLPIRIDEPKWKSELKRDPAIYAVDDWFPQAPYEMGEPMIFRDFRVVPVTLYPVQVNPVTGRARLYSSIEVELVANGLPGVNELVNPRPPSGAFAPLYSAMIPNLDPSVIDEATTRPGSYLILCRNHATVMPWADSLATWKRQLGFDVTVDARANWTTSQMVQTIQTAYQNWDPPLEFVCILGDPNAGQVGMPVDGNDWGPYDHAFALGQSGDDIEDIGVGRICCSSSAEFATAFAKILRYERDPYMDDPAWLRRVFLYAGTSNQISSNEILMHWARQQFHYYTGVDTVVLLTHSGDCNNTIIGQQLTAGASFFIWRGTVVGEMTNAAATSMQSSFKNPICLTITCGSGDYDDQPTALSQSWLIAGTAGAPKGAVCGMGTATFNTHVQYNNTVAGGLVYNICNLNTEYIGVAAAGAKAQLYAAFPNNNSAGDFTRWNNLLGDPGMRMWTQQPVVMDVSYPSTVNVGARRIRPQVTDHVTGEPIENALVVIWKGDETYSRVLTDAGGFVDVPLNVLTEGTMVLTVSKRNHKPFIGGIQCVYAAQMVTMSSYTIDDDNSGGTFGNNNDQLNPGEVIDLPLYLRNFGTADTGTQISATLVSNDPDIAVTIATATFPDLQPGDSADGSIPFRITISPTMQAEKRVILTLEVVAAGVTTHSSFEMQCKAGIGQFVSRQVSGGDGDNVLEPGETANLAVTIRNSGDLAMDGVTATLRSLSSFVSVSTNTSSYGNIGIGQTVSTLTPFVCRAHQLAYPGHLAHFYLVLETTGGYRDTVSFAFNIGQIASTDPTGPDAYGYYAYDNTDVSYEQHRSFDYVDISTNPEATNLDINDVGEQAGNGPTYSRLRDLPFPFMFYGQTYTQITICSNGWAAFGDQDEQDEFRNYAIPGQQSPYAMIAAFWDDLRTSQTGQGEWYWHDAVNHRFIIQWKAENTYPNNNNPEIDFEIILLDPEFYPTRTGDGIVVVQYSTILEVGNQWNDVPYSTIGIQAPGNLVGLQYRYMNTAAPGGATLVGGRSIVFTTEARTAFGTITGIVIDQETSQPMTGVQVTVDGQNHEVITGLDGMYTIPNVLIGTYAVRARKFGFNDGVAENIVVELDSTEVVNFSMVHPEIALSVPEINVTVPGQPLETSFSIANDGNGELHYSIDIDYVADSDPLDDPWDPLTEINITGTSGAAVASGCEFVGDYWWVTGWRDGQRSFHRYDLEGDYAGSIPQPALGAEIGMFDLAYDGNLLYGGVDDLHAIFGVDENGVVQDTVPAPHAPNRAIAYDPRTDHFWVGDLGAPLAEVTRTGEVVREFHHGLNIAGLSWNPQDLDGYYLYAFDRGPIEDRRANVYRIHPVTGAVLIVAALDQNNDDMAMGCTITSTWNSTLQVFAGILRNSQSDRLVIHEVTFNTTWIVVTPSNANVTPFSARDVTIEFDTTGLRPFTYRVNLSISNNSADSLLILPVSLTVQGVGVPEQPQLKPLEYALHQNYPNPFNASTNFRFDLKQAGLTTLRVYNLLGQEVATVVNDFLEAGSHSIHFENSALASGLYVYRIESGDFVAARKLVLMK